MSTPVLVLALIATSTPTAAATATATTAAAAAPPATIGADAPAAPLPPDDLGEADDSDDDFSSRARQLVSSVDVHAFVSQGYFRTSSNDYLGTSSDGSFAFTEVGINFTTQLTDRLTTGIQFFGRVLGKGDLQAQFDWFYLDYRVSNWLGLRVGRVKLPFGLYNEFSDIDAARVHVLLPQAIYPTQNRDYLLAQTGGEVYGQVELGDVGELHYRAYGGTVVLDTISAAEGLDVTDVRTPYIVGTRLMWETPVDGLRVGGSLQALRFEFDVRVGPELSVPLQMAGLLPADFDGRMEAWLPAVLWLASLEYTTGELLVAAEYGRWDLSLASDVPAVIPDIEQEREHFYLMVDYRVNSWLHPGAYYSVLFRDVAQREGRSGSTQDLAATLRFDVLPFWIVKLEGHYMNGTAILDSTVNDGRPLTELDRHWLLVLVNTTLYF